MTPQQSPQCPGVTSQQPETRLYRHVPALCPEVVQALQVRPGGRYVDCTVGEGGHAEAVLEAGAESSALLGLDADPEALERARRRLERFGRRVCLVNQNFTNLERLAREQDFVPVDGVLLDLGLSSLQLDEEQRGFTFRVEQPLDMRFDPRQERTADDVVNGLAEAELADIIARYGRSRGPGASHDTWWRPDPSARRRSWHRPSLGPSDGPGDEYTPPPGPSRPSGWRSTVSWRAWKQRWPRR